MIAACSQVHLHAFHIQADRLRCFKWFRMEHVCTASDHPAIADNRMDYLVGRTDERREVRA